MSEQPNMKKCAICQSWKPATIEYFSPNGEGKFYAHCKECRNMIGRGHLVLLQFSCPEGQKRCSKCKQCKPATSDFFAPDMRKTDGFQSICRVCQREAAFHFYYENQDTLLEIKRQFYAENRQLMQERNKHWYEANKEKAQATRRQYRLKYPDKYRAQKHRWYEANRDRVRENTKKWREANRDRIRESVRRWYESHPGRARELRQQWLESNLEKYREYKRTYTKEHPEIFRANRQRRRARRRGLPEDFTGADWERALDYFDRRCVICGRVPDEETIIAADHWIALSDPRPDNPGTVPWNIVPLCHCLKGGRNGCNNSKRNSDPFQWLVRKLGEEKAREKLAEIEAYFEWVRQQDKE